MLLCSWLLSTLTTLLLYAAVAYWFDRRFVFSTWIKLWLAVMALLGPLGTLLTLRTLYQIVAAVRRDLQSQGLTAYPRPERHATTLHAPPHAPAAAVHLLADLGR